MTEEQKALLNMLENDEQAAAARPSKEDLYKLLESEEPQEREELFKLRNGRQVLNPKHSERLTIIKRERPENSKTIAGGRYSRDEDGMAELFAECYKSDTRYCPEFKLWLVYENGAWRRDSGNGITARIQEFYKLMCVYCGEIEDESKRTEYIKFISKMGNTYFRKRMEQDARAKEQLTVYANDFDANPYLINCKNGTYDLKNHRFYEPKASDLLTMQTAFEYGVKGVKFPRWEEFIDEVTEGDKAKAEYLQRALGYSILGKANEECMFILHGKTTRNGKSTLLDAIKHLLGDYAAVANVALICKSGKTIKDANSPTPALAALKGKRFVTMAESDEYGKLDEEMIKQITGGEEISAREMYARVPFSFLPQFTLWLSCNDLPAARDKSLFASDRLRVIEFNRHFKDNEQEKDLKSIFREPEAMKGIFSWLIEGYKKYKREGLTAPKSIQDAVKQYEKDNDLILTFLEECCEHEGEIKAIDLYNRFKIWCKSQGYTHVCTAQKFNNGVKSHSERYISCEKKIKGYPVYEGISLKS